jgi:mannose-1-phosphate guanylyltransferase
MQGPWATHWDAGHNWALVLAAGEGSRLQALTTTASGVAIPKQYCSLAGGSSLLHNALQRARVVAPPERTCTIVARQHERWWRSLQRSIPANNIVVQPRNRGTANGILLPLLQIVHRDPNASLLVLPSDHYVRNETVLAVSLQQAMAQLDRQRGSILLLGLAPEEPDPELGYIVPSSQVGPPAREVQQFIEKPSVAAARQLMQRGGLWNSFIFAVHGQMLVRAFEECCPDIVAQMRSIVAHGAAADSQGRLEELYERLPAVDFSRDIAQQLPQRLRVLSVPACGWSDLGTPRRVAQVLDQHQSPAPLPPAIHSAGFLDLSTQQQRLLRAG